MKNQYKAFVLCRLRSKYTNEEKGYFKPILQVCNAIKPISNRFENTLGDDKE